MSLLALFSALLVHQCGANVEMFFTQRCCYPRVTTVQCTTTHTCLETVRVTTAVDVTVTNAQTIWVEYCPPAHTTMPVIEVWSPHVPPPMVDEVCDTQPAATVTSTCTTTATITSTISREESVCVTVTNTRTSLEVFCPPEMTAARPDPTPTNDAECSELTTAVCRVDREHIPGPECTAASSSSSFSRGEEERQKRKPWRRRVCQKRGTNDRCLKWRWITFDDLWRRQFLS